MKASARGRCASLLLAIVTLGGTPSTLVEAQESVAGEKPAGAIGTVDSTGSSASEQSADDVAENKVNLTFYGFLRGDAIYDFRRVDPDWNATFLPSRIALDEEEFGSYGETVFSVKPTILGTRGDVLTSTGRPVSWRFEFDLYGLGENVGETAFHLRYLWIEYGALGIGQHETLFMDVSSWPRIMEYWGPNGWVINRNPQVRFTHRLGQSHLAVGLEQANTSLDGGVFKLISPELADRLVTRSKLPDLTAQYRGVHDWGHWQIAGVARQLSFETVDTPNNEPKRDLFGWGLSGTAVINTTGSDRVYLQATYGHGIGSFINDGSFNIAPQDGRADTIPLFSMVLFYDHYWSDAWSSTLGYSRLDMDTRNQQLPGEFDIGEYALANLLHDPVENLTMGLEGTWGRRKLIDGTAAQDVRVKFSVQYAVDFPWSR